jgi:broad specificity phosphatase PhoE
MTTFYICRHGETENNRAKRLSGWIDTPLTGAGVLNAISSAKKLKGVRFDKIIASDLGRAFRTAYIIAQEIGSDLYIDTTPGLREVNYGDIANTPYSGPGVVYPSLTPEENTHFTPPNGESLAQMQTRVITAIQKLAVQYPDKTVLLVAHDGTINAVYAACMDKNIGVVDAERNNAHDFVAKFVFLDGVATDFREIQG